MRELNRNQISKKLILIIILFFLFNLYVQVETFRNIGEYEITIPPEYYCHYDLNITTITKLIAEWEVNSGPPVDVYLLTKAQYEKWLENPYYYPTEAIYINIGTNNGSINYILKDEGQYYLIFSNIWGFNTTDINITERTMDIANVINRKIGGFWLYTLLITIPIILGVSYLVYITHKWFKKRKNKEIELNLKKQTTS